MVKDPVGHTFKHLTKAIRSRLVMQAPLRNREEYIGRLFELGIISQKSYVWEGLRTEADLFGRSLLELLRKSRYLNFGRRSKQTYVLRNHSKKVFVLEDPFITSFAECIGTEGQLTLEHVALSQCGRSADPSVSMAVDASDELINGPWSGDELDTVTEKEFRRSFRSGEEVSAEWRNNGA